MGLRAECAMLNKRPHIIEAVQALADVLRRRYVQQINKRPVLRRLILADNLVPLKGAHLPK